MTEEGFIIKSYNDVPFLYRDEKDKRKFNVKMMVAYDIIVDAFDEEDAIREAIWDIDTGCVDYIDREDCHNIEVIEVMK